MNILQLVPSLESGGVEQGTLDLSREFKKRGHNTIVISGGGKLVKHLEKDGIEHITFPVHKKSPVSLLLVPRLTNIIKSRQIDIVHASSRVPAWLGFFAARRTHTPFVTSCHGFYSKHFFSSVMAKGELVMVISETIKARMTEAFGVPEEKIRLVYRGLDLSLYNYQGPNQPLRNAHPTVVNIGRLTPIKGQIEFINAMKIICEKIPGAAAWIVGAAGKDKTGYENKLKALVLELGLGKNIKFLGLQNDIPKLLNESDCLVLSSIVPEGFGRTVIEAGAAGVPVCASNIGGIREIVEDGASGLLFPPGDVEQMASAIIRMLTDQPLRSSCIRALREKVEQNFTLQKMTNQTLAVYEEAIASHR
ncbi:MAG: GT4 family glycosyltransferase PelF [Candidatus Omnitrophica bacterium]|nr:GT4 family glycosyltransferase PelF [Candidatus Omnitrophota bacterium]